MALSVDGGAQNRRIATSATSKAMNNLARTVRPVYRKIIMVISGEVNQMELLPKSIMIMAFV